ncbi:MAG TPA: tRNA preQ1(34) S-adenosylmethionine ribosyltransferase-isomerase QueA [Planctomycetes bacterium]|nr:tRNA preQ1(34) S-adenosylmethionine ribosyltransferase-isomerase QueA [Planctomycetota bacterium]HIJ70068.1 tRNA preQ1(34) S-adenosylmethionine ribosyltransferase-isomerase QueA [Planctomycetota bacterium]
MRTKCLNYNLPSELIAQSPNRTRGTSRLLVMDRRAGTVLDRRFADVLEYIGAGDCVVFNNTKVLPARFFARRRTGAKLEALFVSQRRNGLWEVMVKGAGKVKTGEMIVLRNREGVDFHRVKAVERTRDGRWLLDVGSAQNADRILAQIGFAPLPPYIKRNENKQLAKTDLRRYQTVYAEKSGAVAAPTAGLHFTERLLEQLKQKGVRLAFITLHVGPGTFAPIKTEKLEEHKMHAEWFSILPDSANLINDTKQKGGRIIAVGTTSVRTLEAVCRNGKVAPFEGVTDLFIMPGYEFRMVDAMITNFHLPRSSLLALVCAFAGLDKVLEAYHHAVEERYRFYSYGDAMLII